MLAVDESFYKEKYKGVELPTDFFERNVDQAVDIVNQWCHCFFDFYDLADLNIEADQIRVQKAVCAQVEYFFELGGNTEQSKDNNTVTSMTVGNFSMANSGSSGPSTIYSSKAYGYLRPTGLLYGGLSHYEC